MINKLSELDKLITEVMSMRGVVAEKEMATKDIDFDQEEKQLTIKLPQFRITEDWGTKEGRPDVIKKFFSKVEGDTLEAKIKSLNDFVTNCDEESCINDVSAPQVLTNLVTLDILASIIHQFGPSPAGFLFEAFLAALVSGTQIVPDKSISTEDIINKDGQPISIKLLKKDGYVHGSYKDLAAAWTQTGPDKEKPVVQEAGEAWDGTMKYLVVNKLGSEDELILQWYLFPVTKVLMADMLKATKSSGKKGRYADIHGTQFRIKKEYYKQFPLATLNIGSRSNIVEIARRYADKLGDSMFQIYSLLDSLGNNINNYFLDQDTKAAKLAADQAEDLKKAIENY